MSFRAVGELFRVSLVFLGSWSLGRLSESTNAEALFLLEQINFPCIYWNVSIFCSCGTWFKL